MASNYGTNIMKTCSQHQQIKKKFKAKKASMYASISDVYSGFEVIERESKFDREKKKKTTENHN